MRGMKAIFDRHQRQVHLDFHTSPFIPDVGCEFDAAEFASAVGRARVNSVTVFAKCHHGMCYYPTATGTSHPALGKRDLLGEQIEALHRRGIRAPIYTTVVWEEDVAQRFPQWRQLTREGHFAGENANPAGKPGHAGAWKFNNPLDPAYQDYIEAHVREICERYGREVDGFFFDILFFAPDACWSEACVAFRKKLGLMGDDRATFDRFQGAAQAAFAKKFTRLVHGLRPRATVFYNAHNDGNMDPGVGPRARAAFQTHCEIESLPSGFWGYYHFPRMARAQGRWGKPWLGMTGRFQKMGDQAAGGPRIRMFPHAGPRGMQLGRRPAAAARHAGSGRLRFDWRGVWPVGGSRTLLCGVGGPASGGRHFLRERAGNGRGHKRGGGRPLVRGGPL